MAIQKLVFQSTAHAINVSRRFGAVERFFSAFCDVEVLYSNKYSFYDQCYETLFVAWVVLYKMY